MNTARRWLILSFALITLTILVPLATAEIAPPSIHTWKSIEYPPVPMPGREKESLNLRVGSGGNGEASHLRLDILWSTGHGIPLPPEIADGSKFEVRLHLSDGTIVSPMPSPFSSTWNGAGSRGMTWSLIHFFPWQRNLMEEAWFELKLSGQTYWIELPYGFTRNPADPLPSDAGRNEPAFPPTMKTLGESDRLVPWLHVNYDLGKVQNGWRLSCKVANPFDARVETILYRDDTRVGKSMFLWKVETPKTAVEIRPQGRGGDVVKANLMGIRLHEDGMRRSDDYTLSRNPEDGRDWGTLIIKVDDQSYRCVVPSSLFKYVHGVTEHGNPHRLPRPEPLRDR